MLTEKEANDLWEYINTRDSVKGVLELTVYFFEIDGDEYEITIDEHGDVYRIVDGDGKTLYE